MNAPLGIVSRPGIVLESLLDAKTEVRAFDAFPGLSCGAVPDPDRKFIWGTCGGFPVVLQCSRFHMYEGLDYATVTRPVDILHSFGVRTILFTNAAGGLKPGMAPGDLVGIQRVRMWRYCWWKATPGVLFTDFVVPDCDFTGTYQWMHGPCYETRAEIAAIQNLTAEAVGMSTAPELLRCQEIGIRAGVIACITNSCCRPATVTDEEVVTAARKLSARLAAIIRRRLPEILQGADTRALRPGAEEK
jgi:purine-nucleoside phosphorylase